VRRGALIVALCAFAALPAVAQDSLEIAKRRELEEIQRQARENRDAAARLKKQESGAVTTLRRTDRRLNEVRNRLRNLQGQRKRLDQQLEINEANLERSRESLTRLRARLAKRLRSMYKTGAGRELEFLLSTQSFGQLLARWDFLVMVAEQDRLLMENVRDQKQQVEADRNRLENNLTAVDRNAKRSESETKQLATLRTERARNVTTIQTQRQAYEAAAAELEKAARDLRNLLARLEAKRREEADAARAQGRAPQPYSGDFAAAQGQLDWPARGNVVGRFGIEEHPVHKTKIMNNGIDIEAGMGTAVKAVAKGRVDYTSEDFSTYGQMIILNHGDGYYTMYGHLSVIGVTVGQEVSAGTVIGAVGDTGSLKGTVLHFEVRKGGTALNPEDWLR
jgi:septal ring factor EnvC (AmiA/AmiB activator)